MTTRGCTRLRLTRMGGVIALLIVAAMTARAQQPPPAGHDTSELAKASQNPVGELISVPFQFNFNTDGDLEDRTFFYLNIQPVMPLTVTPRINLIARTIVSVVSIPGAQGLRHSGFGDIQQQLFFTSSSPSTVIWGVGPAFSLPTATADIARTGTWAGGVDAVMLMTPGPWVVGGLVSQFWPMADAGGEPETHQLVFQWFVNYNFGQGWALASAPLNTVNWDAEDGQQWTVPLGLGLSKTTVFDGRPLTLGAQYYYNVKRPDGTAATQLRFTITLLYPTARK